MADVLVSMPRVNHDCLSCLVSNATVNFNTLDTILDTPVALFPGIWNKVSTTH